MTGRIAVIPARGGSKRIPRKNIRSFAGRPMIGYAVDAALASNLFDHIVVSTDDAEIADIARDAGALLPFMRPAELADDTTPTVPVVQHALEQCVALGWRIDHLCCIYPGVPFLQPEDLVATLRLVELGAAPYVFPVTAFPSPIQRALRLGPDGRVAPFMPENVNVRTQDLEPFYHDAGQFYWGTADAWRQGLNIHANGAGYPIPEWRVVDIDTPEDWDRAELMASALRSRDTGAAKADR